MRRRFQIPFSVPGAQGPLFSSRLPGSGILSWLWKSSIINCSADLDECHFLKMPLRYSRSRWRELVPLDPLGSELLNPKESFFPQVSSAVL